jgi:cyclopropane-fatty-acyl-phospholipid synthase
MPLATEVHTMLGSPESIGVEAYDHSRIAPPHRDATVVVRRPEAIGRIVRAPGELGLVRAYVCGDLDLEGDLFEVLEHGFATAPDALRADSLARVVWSAGPKAWRAIIAPPPPPPEEVRLHGTLHSSGRDARAIAHHYDVSNRFYELVLGSSMTYSCAVFTDRDEPLADAQRHKHELICTKLGLGPGMRLLDVGCGWGSLLLHAVEHHGVTGVGITISKEQAELARKRVADAGFTDRIDIRLQDYRDVADGPFDAISSVGMFEHVGRARMEEYARRLFELIAPGGRLLNHAISRPVVTGAGRPPSHLAALVRRVEVALGSAIPSRVDSALMNRYVFPDGELHEVGTTVSLLQEVGFEVRHEENLREHYALTLRRWVANLDEHWDEAVAEVGERRARVWKLYMSACAIGFEQHSTEVHQVLAVRDQAGGDAHMPLRPIYSL